MDKRDYIIIGLLIIIVALLSYNVINVYKSSEPEVFAFNDYTVTAPAGSHYHNQSGQAFYLSDKDAEPVFAVSNNSNMSVQNFDLMYNALKNGSVSKSDMIKLMNYKPENDSVISDINVGDFKGEPELSLLMENPKNQSEKALAHMIKHNNKVFLVMERLDNSTSTQMYNTLILT